MKNPGMRPGFHIDTCGNEQVARFFFMTKQDVHVAPLRRKPFHRPRHRVQDRLHATVDLERRDARAPVKRAVGLQIFGGVPEGAVVNRIHTHVAVIAPAGERPGLRASTLNDDGFIA